MKLFKNKRGQYYIFIALLLIAYAFNIARPEPLVQEKPDAFKELYSNFMTESTVVVNNALYNDQNVTEKFTAFADAYIDYARTKSPKFRLAYVLKDGGVLVVGNKLGISINVTLTNGTTYNLLDGGTVALAPQDFALDVVGLTYDFDIGSETYQVQSLFRQKTETETRIFVNN